MLTYPKRFEQLLEVDQIREIIKTYCFSEAAKNRVDGAKPIAEKEQLLPVLHQTAEMIRVVSSGLAKPGDCFEDIMPFLKKLRTPGTFLEPSDLSLLKNALRGIHDWSQFFKKNNSDLPNLSALTAGFAADLALAEEIESKIDERRGEVRDDATPELTTIRKHIFGVERQVRKVIQSILERSKKQAFTDEESTVTIRAGRLVIPVRAEFKRKLAGFVHDESATGQTVFMEPTEVLDLNNQVYPPHLRSQKQKRLNN